jgi:hypothetical protein
VLSSARPRQQACNQTHANEDRYGNYGRKLQPARQVLDDGGWNLLDRQASVEIIAERDALFRVA